MFFYTREWGLKEGWLIETVFGGHYKAVFVYVKLVLGLLGKQKKPKAPNLSFVKNTLSLFYICYFHGHLYNSIVYK